MRFSRWYEDTHRDGGRPGGLGRRVAGTPQYVVVVRPAAASAAAATDTCDSRGRRRSNQGAGEHDSEHSVWLPRQVRAVTTTVYSVYSGFMHY